MSLSLVFLLFVVDIFFISVSSQKMERAQSFGTETVCRSGGEKSLGDVPKISEIKNPMITEQAATSVCRKKPTPSCKDLGLKAWAFLLMAYLGLLVSNLVYGFLKNQKIQWIWELIMTIIFLGFWFPYDECAFSLWYPLYVAKLSIAVYGIYLYFFLRKKIMSEN